MEPYPARADAERLAVVSAELAARFRDVLRSAGFAAAADKPELLDRGAKPDIVSGVTNSTVSLALIAVRRGFRNILDLGAGCGVVCHGRRVRPGRRA